jgi:hypothetical protein
MRTLDLWMCGRVKSRPTFSAGSATAWRERAGRQWRVLGGCGPTTVRGIWTLEHGVRREEFDELRDPAAVEGTRK